MQTISLRGYWSLLRIPEVVCLRRSVLFHRIFSVVCYSENFNKQQHLSILIEIVNSYWNVYYGLTSFLSILNVWAYLILTKNHKVDANITSIVQMKKLMEKEVKWLSYVFCNSIVVGESDIANLIWVFTSMIDCFYQSRFSRGTEPTDYLYPYLYLYL